jgi:hypothetical protein
MSANYLIIKPPCTFHSLSGIHELRITSMDCWEALNSTHVQYSSQDVLICNLVAVRFPKPHSLVVIYRGNEINWLKSSKLFNKKLTKETSSIHFQGIIFFANAKTIDYVDIILKDKFITVPRNTKIDKLFIHSFIHF